jgi:dienelactone hydrolase
MGRNALLFDGAAMKRLTAVIIAALCMPLGTSAGAQVLDAPSASAPDFASVAARLAPDLTFPVEAEPASAMTIPRMAMLKPDGAGPFPAIVLLHQCSGLNTTLMDWARAAVTNGYVVLLVDSFGQRGVQSVCGGPRAGVNLVRGARDALQAGEHLRRQPFVDKDRIALVGFSWGAMVGLLADSRHYIAALDAGSGFAAVASFYPGCFRISPPNGSSPYEVLNLDIAHPLLVLMGEADTETPSAECIDRLQAAKATGAPVAWHVYPAATHCWDCQHADGLRKIDIRGDLVTYRFDEEVTRDSRDRLFDFLTAVLARR